MRYLSVEDWITAIKDFDRQYPDAFWEVIDVRHQGKFGVSAQYDSYKNNTTTVCFLIRQDLLKSVFNDKIEEYNLAVSKMFCAKHDLLSSIIGSHVNEPKSKYPPYLRLVK